MEVRTQQVIYGVAEVIAAHNLLRYVRKNTDEEKLRMAAGATMAGLGYVFGPQLQERITHLKDVKLTESMKEHLVYAAGGAMLGGILGYKVGPQMHTTTIQPIEMDKPSGLVVIASAAWLGYSLFFDGKTSEEQQRHLWGLGAGMIGYLYGPEMIRKVSTMVVPKEAHDDTLEIFARGGAIVGGIAGGVLGWYKGDNFLQLIKGEKDARTFPKNQTSKIIH